MNIFGQLIKARLQNVTGAISQWKKGAIYFRADTNRPYVDDGTDVSEIQMKKHLFGDWIENGPSTTGKAGQAYVLNSSLDGFDLIPVGNSPQITTDLTTDNIDWGLSQYFKKNISTNKTFTFSNVVSGKTTLVKIKNDTSNQLTIDFPPGSKQVTDLTCTDNNGDILDGKYFILHKRKNDKNTSVAFWFDSNASGTAMPNHGADENIEIDTIVTGDSSVDVATRIHEKINSIGTSQVTTLTTRADSNDDLDAKYFILYERNGSNINSVAFWFDVDNTGTTAPIEATNADRNIKISTILTNDSANTVANKVAIAINADSAFSATNSNDTVTITNTNVGSVNNPLMGNSGFLSLIDTEGFSEFSSLISGSTLTIKNEVKGVVASPSIGNTSFSVNVTTNGEAGIHWLDGSPFNTLNPNASNLYTFINIDDEIFANAVDNFVRV